MNLKISCERKKNNYTSVILNKILFLHSGVALNRFIFARYKQQGMTENQQEKIKTLLEKYNDILLVSMRLAVAEDFTGLVILNRDDTDFELSELLQNKNEFSNYILKEFLKNNSNPITSELGKMEELKFNIQKRTRTRTKAPLTLP